MRYGRVLQSDIAVFDRVDIAVFDRVDIAVFDRVIKQCLTVRYAGAFQCELTVIYGIEVFPSSIRRSFTVQYSRVL